MVQVHVRPVDPKLKLDWKWSFQSNDPLRTDKSREWLKWKGGKKKNGLLCSFEDHGDIMEGFEMGRKSNKTFNNPATERGVKALVRMGTNAILA